MYGLLIEAVIDFTKRKYGQEIWDTINAKCKIDNMKFNTTQQYSETLFIRMIKCLIETTKSDTDVLMEELGIDFVDFTAQYGYDKILSVLGRHMRDFLNGLDNLHEYMRFSYAKLKPPSFYIESESATGLILHYRSKRKGFRQYVKGQIKQVGKKFYNLDVNIEILLDQTVNDLTHVIYKLHFKNDQFNQISTDANLQMQQLAARTYNSVNDSLYISSLIFFELFPFHLVFTRSLQVISIGHGLRHALKDVEGESLKDLFNLVRPFIPMTWESIIAHTNNVFELITIEPIRRHDLVISDKGKLGLEATFDECLKLKGQMMPIKEWDAIIYIATPVLENLDIMFKTGFYINDLSMHDSSRDLVLVGSQQAAELRLALDEERSKSTALESYMTKLDTEMKKTDQLLYQMIPKKIADRIKAGEDIMSLCEIVPCVTILFSDVCGFTSTCSQLLPMEVVNLLNSMYTKFDKSLLAHDVYKVETIGDAYMVVSGLPERNNNHAAEILEMSIDMMNNISTLLNPTTQQPMKMRIGCHSGPVVAGVVGLKMPRYCLFGDTVVTANKMESSSQPMRIHISESTKTLLDSKRYKIESRGTREIVKGKGEMTTYFFVCKTDDKGNMLRSPFMEAYDDLIAAGVFPQPISNDQNKTKQLPSEQNKAKQIPVQKATSLNKVEKEPIKELMPKKPLKSNTEQVESESKNEPKKNKSKEKEENSSSKNDSKKESKKETKKEKSSDEKSSKNKELKHQKESIAEVTASMEQAQGEGQINSYVIDEIETEQLNDHQSYIINENTESSAKLNGISNGSVPRQSYLEHMARTPSPENEDNVNVLRKELSKKGPSLLSVTCNML